MKYHKDRIIKALLLAPVPLLFFAALLFIIMNSEFSPYSILVVFAGHALVYLAYCILTVPFSFLFSILLERYNALNLLTICISALIIAAPFFILLGWSHTGQVSAEWWKMYSNPSAIFIAIFPGVCCWLFLINLKSKTKLWKEKYYISVRRCGSAFRYRFMVYY